MIYSYGTDISKWQDDPNTIQQIDLQKNKDAGCDFVFIRGMFSNRVDEDFEYNWIESRLVGLLRGAYHFVDYRADPVHQAQAFVRLLDFDKGELPPVLDFERYAPFGDIDYIGAINFIRAYMDIIDVALDTTTMLYTNPNWLLHRLRTTRAKTPVWLLKHPLWVAHWGDILQPITGDWPNWTFWQHTNTAHGPTYGAESNAVDMNRFNGDTSALYRRFGIDTPSPPDAEWKERMTRVEDWIRKEL